MAKVLVIDNDINDADLISLHLEKAGHSITYASSARNALDTIEVINFDVVITDIIMPEIDGLDFIKELNNTGKKIPVIAVSGLGKQFLPIAEVVGASYIIEKSDNYYEKLIERVNRLTVAAP